METQLFSLRSCFLLLCSVLHRGSSQASCRLSRHSTPSFKSSSRSCLSHSSLLFLSSQEEDMNSSSPALPCFLRPFFLCYFITRSNTSVWKRRGVWHMEPWHHHLQPCCSRKWSSSGQLGWFLWNISQHAFCLHTHVPSFCSADMYDPSLTLLLYSWLPFQNHSPMQYIESSFDKSEFDLSHIHSLNYFWEYLWNGNCMQVNILDTHCWKCLFSEEEREWILWDIWLSQSNKKLTCPLPQLPPHPLLC